MSQLEDLAERYREAGLDVIGVDENASRIDFAVNSTNSSLGIGRSLGRYALEHGFAITSFAFDNLAAPSTEQFEWPATVWFDRIQFEKKTETVEVEKEVDVIYHEKGHGVIHDA